jgi:phage/plasmid-associated DNA primase
VIADANDKIILIVFASLCSLSTRYKLAFMLQGEGKSGKSQFLDMI